MKPTLTLAHSPDPDDAFMWWPLVGLDGQSPPVVDERFRFETVHEDIEQLNAESTFGRFDITAMSCAQYPRVRDRYAITACGASMGAGYGPKLVARAAQTVEELQASDPLIAVPGVRTSAFGAASLLLGRGSFRHEAVPFDAIIERVARGDFDAGIVIHEGQLTFEDSGLHLVEDLGAWWQRTRGGPLPLGVNAIRRDLEERHGPGTLEAVTRTLLASVEHALAHREQSIAHALEFARDMGAELADEFVSLYVNQWTLDFGPDGRRSVQAFLAELAAAGLAPEPGAVDFVEPASLTA